ncbi:MAG TPA: glycogen debranching protein GlgX [Burkholderiaceae bacterium]|nr:glycogen debranching protein GlgX [Burkholderiaceae bacterium]HMX10339.1 glycogen debranching protein GlgX [Burkholderiaceae bacterium]HMY99336.1 glycogen debranching protein GlgX [Burkholderiaceae bacterium]HNB43712.1 glycogen debranching protein GlgX [Burkholderiaceae bacterium]HNG82144.1 glycogen debranching protein GlgX [Burkholderiaceae bacterium]
MGRSHRNAAPQPGRPFPLGARPEPAGVNFSVYSRHARRAELLLYDDVNASEPARTLVLDGDRHRTWDYWHVFVPGLRPGQIYAWRMQGPFDPARGHRFDGDKLLLDPYGRAVAVPRDYRRDAARGMGRNDAWAMKSVVADDHAYDWEGDQPLRRPFSQTVIYETHVRGFTRHPSSGLPARLRGSYAGLTAKIPYLVDLGITAVELMPVFQFDAQDAPPGHLNYWGYAPLSFFAPHAAYASRQQPLAVLDEFRDMVKALHRAGLEVILDVVYNHTAEGDAQGPCLSLRGLDNATYYLLGPQGEYANYSGCGNTLNANQAVVRRLILDSLRYWVQVMHVDGFRFDLASILSRDEQGCPLARPPVLWDIDSDPVLAGTKLIAEAWDAAGLYQVGNFAGDHWKEWNGRFRDDVRAFVRGDLGVVPALADRLIGSPALYGERPREPAQSINFITSHDGFTLHDLVSYNHKHNDANGEANRDGHDDNRSWNCGAEGPSDDPEVLALRTRQAKNLLAINLLALGTPMLLMGDELLRSQQGNNNAYCQDNETSWLDWTLLKRHAEIHRFVRGLIRIRNLRESVRIDHHLTLEELIARVKVSLHGVQLGAPDLATDSHSLAITASSLSGDLLMHFALNAYWEALDFELPALPDWASSGWRRVIDSHRPAPQDLVDFPHADPVSGPTHRVEARSVVVLFAGQAPQGSDAPVGPSMSG